MIGTVGAEMRNVYFLEKLDRLPVPYLAVLDILSDFFFRDSGKLWSLKRSRNI
jgi:hypothetical protein